MNYNDIHEIVNSFVKQAEKDIQKNSAVVDRNFEITHRKMMSNYVRVKANNEVKAYILDNVRLDDGILFGTMAEIAKDIHISIKTVSDSFKVLQENDFIQYYRDGVWPVNPKLLRKGTGGKYLGQLRFYESLPKRMQMMRST